MRLPKVSKNAVKNPTIEDANIGRPIVCTVQYHIEMLYIFPPFYFTDIVFKTKILRIIIEYAIIKPLFINRIGHNTKLQSCLYIQLHFNKCIIFTGIVFIYRKEFIVLLVPFG